MRDNTVTGSIARMIVIRGCELARVINKRAEKTNQKKISETRYTKEETEKKCQPREQKNSFRINNEWHNDDESVYDEITSKISRADYAMLYVEKN